jgi:hypothetical protein
VALFGLLWHLVGVFTDMGPGGLLAGTAAATAVLLAVMLAASALPRQVAAEVHPLVTRRILREQAGRTGMPRHRDPDAAGRSRPRAPTAALAAA